MEDKSELIKTFLMSVEFSDRDDIEIKISKSGDIYHIVLYVYLGPYDGIYSRMTKSLNIPPIKNSISKYGICDTPYLKVDQGWKDYYKSLI